MTPMHMANLSTVVENRTRSQESRKSEGLEIAKSTDTEKHIVQGGQMRKRFDEEKSVEKFLNLKTRITNRAIHHIHNDKLLSFR